MPQSLVPAGFRMAGLHCGLKKNPNKEDITLVVAEKPAVAAGVYTQNVVHAAPVALDRARTPSDQIRAVVVNSGNANACTGEQGMRDATRMTELAAAACGARPEQALVMSTGVIGRFLPMDTVAAGIERAAGELGAENEHFERAARGILTTDIGPKTAHAVVESAGGYSIAGMAKGAGMIGPNMATMLGLVLTDARLTPADAQRILSETADATFNCISVEGHTSTNDTLLLLASGAAMREPLAGRELAEFQTRLEAMCIELAKQIPADGEGSTHLIEIQIRGLRSVAEARQIARTVANSALVKTAITGGDPNWGRIVSAAGYAGVPFDPAGVDLHVNGIELYRSGAPVAFDAPTASASIKGKKDTEILLTFREGEASARFWTSDLTVEYVRFNAEYTT